MIDLEAYLRVMRDETISDVSTITNTEVEAMLCAETLTPHDTNLLRRIAAALHFGTIPEEISEEDVVGLVDRGIVTQSKNSKHYDLTVKGWLALDLYLDSRTQFMVKRQSFTYFFNSVKEEIGRVQSSLKRLVLQVPSDGEDTVPTNDVSAVTNMIRLFL